VAGGLVHHALWNKHPQSWFPKSGKIGAFEKREDYILFNLYEFSGFIDKMVPFSPEFEDLTTIVLDS